MTPIISDQEPNGYLMSKGESSVNITTVYRFLTQLKHVTAICQDIEGRVFQLFKLSTGLIGAMQEVSGGLTFFPGDKIHNGLNPSSTPQEILKSLEKFEPKKWHIIFDPNRIGLTILPFLEASGRKFINAPIKSNSMFAKMTRDQIITYFNERGYVPKIIKGHLSYERAGKNGSWGLTYYFDDDNKPDHPPHIDIYMTKESERGMKEIYLVRKKKWLGTIKGRFTYKVEGGSNPTGRKPNLAKPNHNGPGLRNFHQTLQQTGLTKSYNSCHADNPAPKGAGGGEIGGVGCTVELIEGLFDSPESLFETQHSFFIPTFEGEAPFSSQEMGQIIHELARGIFIHGTVPFFSLHFNQEANLYPVIHPAYENTLVGQVFGMLDYFMKGYLNGGVFKESFIEKWHQNPSENLVDDALLNELINFKSYAELHLTGNDTRYLSMRELLKRGELKALQKVEGVVNDAINKVVNKDYVPENPIFKDYTKFTNSFRIIAKQNGIHKAENLFMIDSDFDVLYTIDPNPDYKKALDEHYKLHGNYPEAYENLLEAYELMKSQIRNHMIKMPFCRKYFSMLGVINFFSYYFMTLKKHHKVPVLPEVDLVKAQCPSLFPPLPILDIREEEWSANIYEILMGLIKEHQLLLKKYLLNQATPNEIDQLRAAIEQLLWEEVNRRVSLPMRRHMIENSERFRNLCRDCADQIDLLEGIRSIFTEIDEQTRNDPNRKPIHKIVKIFIEEIPAIFARNNKLTKIASMHHELFVLPSEQTPEEREIGQKVVGGCGMVVSPLKVQSSPTAHTILDNFWGAIQETPFGEWSQVTSSESTASKGVIFTLPFMDIPQGYSKDPSDMELLLAYSSENEFYTFGQIIKSMTQGDQETFTKLSSVQDVKELRDRENRSLLHYSATLETPFFSNELLKMGLSPFLKDNKEYLPIHYAAMSGCVTQLKFFIEKNKSNLFCKSNQGATPLIVAIQHGQNSAVEFLLKAGADGDERLKDGYTALHCAVHHNDEKIVRSLLEQSKMALSMINTQTNEGITPLMIACRLGTPSLAAYLLEKGADPKIIAKNGTTALEIAVKQDHLELCRILAPCSNLTATTIEIAIKMGSIEINQLLIILPGYLTYSNPLKETPLLMAIRYANIPVAKLILDLISDPAQLNIKNRLKETAVILAAKGKFYPFLEELLKKQAPISSMKLFELLLQTGYHGQYPSLHPWLNQALTVTEINQLILTAAKAGNHAGITHLLLPKNPNLNNVNGPNGWKIDHYLAKSDGIYLFRMRLLETNNLLHPLVKEKGKTLPYIAGENGSWRVLEYLLGQLKAQNISLKNHYKGRDLFYSVLKRGDLEGIRLFVEKNDHLQLVNQSLGGDEIFPVHVAARYGELDTFEYLHSQGANFNVRDHQGHFPLYYAVQREDEDLIKFLLNEKHANLVTAVTLDRAASYENDGVFQLLLTGGTDVNESFNPEQETALFLAIKRHDKNACLRLIQSGASVIHKNRNGLTPLVLANLLNQAEIVSIILSKNPQVAFEEMSDPKLDVQSYPNGRTPLFDAIKNRQLKNVKSLIQAGANIEHRDHKGLTPLILACQTGNYPIVRLLVKSGADVNRKALKGLTPLFFSLLSKNEDISLFLLFNGAKLDGINHKEGFIGHLAAELGKVYVLRFIAEQGLSLAALNQNGIQPIHSAAIAGKIRAVEFLTSHGVSVETAVIDTGLEKEKSKLLKNATPILLASFQGTVEAVKWLLDHGADPEKQTDTGLNILKCALRNTSVNSQELIQILKEYRLINDLNQILPAILLAIAKDYVEPLKLLYEIGVPIQSAIDQGFTGLHMACKYGSLNATEFLLTHGADSKAITHSGQTPIELAAANHSSQQFALMLNRTTPELDAQNSRGETLMHLATKAGNISHIILLIDLGADFEVQNSQGQTPLHIAAENGFEEIVTLLMICGADPDIRTFFNSRTAEDFANHKIKNLMNKLHLLIKEAPEGSTPLHIAVRACHTISVRLTARHFDVDGKNAIGRTPLHEAVSTGSLEIIRELLSLGANLNEKDQNGMTPLEIAHSESANSSVEKFLFRANLQLNQSKKIE